MELHSFRTLWDHISRWLRSLTDFDGSVHSFQSLDRQSNAYAPMLVSLLWLLMPCGMHLAASISIVIDLYHLCYTWPFHSLSNAINQPMDMYYRYCYYYFVCKCLIYVYRNTNDPNPLHLMTAVRMLVASMMMTSAVVAAL